MSDPFDPIPEDAYERGGYLPEEWTHAVEGETYQPSMIDHLLPGMLGIPMHPSFPMFRYQIMLTLKDGDGDSGSCTNQHSWPVEVVPRLVEQAGGLDLWLRTVCREMMSELTESLFEVEEPQEGYEPDYPTMRYTGRFYISGHIPPGMDTDPGTFHPAIPAHELAMVSMVGNIMGCVS